MANGETFDELRKLAEKGTDIPVKSMLRLIMAAIAEMHKSTEAHRKDVKARLEKIEGITKYPSALWYLANMPLKTLAVFVVIGLVMMMVFVPEARTWAGEQVLKVILGGL